MTVLGIDPGPTESGYALVRSDYTIEYAAKVANAVLLDEVLPMLDCSDVAIEEIQSFKKPVGRSIFRTCYQIGRILRDCELRKIKTTLYYRQEYARAICGTSQVSDAILRRSLLLRFGGDQKGEPLAALKGSTDKRSAFAVAVYRLDLLRLENGISANYVRDR